MLVFVVTHGNDDAQKFIYFWHGCLQCLLGSQCRRWRFSRGGSFAFQRCSIIQVFTELTGVLVCYSGYLLNAQVRQAMATPFGVVEFLLVDGY
jgi:hypothetical protein